MTLPAPTFGITVLERLEVELAEVESAIEALQTSTYGVCRVCGESLDRNLLRRSPVALQCVEHVAVPDTGEAPEPSEELPDGDPFE